MNRLPPPPAELFRLEWFSDGWALAEVATDASDHEFALTRGADAGRVGRVGTLHSFVDQGGAIRGRVSLREPVELRLTLLRPAVVSSVASDAGLLEPLGGSEIVSAIAATVTAAAPAPQPGGRPALVSVVADFGGTPGSADGTESTHPAGAHGEPAVQAAEPRFLRLAAGGVTAPRLVEAEGSRVSLALSEGEYFFELCASTTADDAARARPLNRRTHHLARVAAE